MEIKNPSRTRRQGRHLTTLVIDDENQSPTFESRNYYRRYLNFEFISSWGEAQHRLRSGTATQGADMLLVDVGWLSDQGFSLVSQAKPESSVQPLGPLLALPFLGLRPIMSCVLYSGHSKNESLLRNTSFLLAMGLITARTSGVPTGGYQSNVLRPFENGEKGSLDRVIDEFRTKSHPSATDALRAGIDELREDLQTRIKDGVVAITNRTDLVTRLNDIVRRNEAGELVEADDSLYIGLAADGWADCLSIPSLFADKLEWGGRFLTKEWAELVLEWVNFLKRDAVAMAIEVVLEQDRSEADESSIVPVRPAAKKMIDDMFGASLEPSERSEILRYVILFANVYANEEFDNPGWGSVSERLAEKGKLDANTYLGWFGLRPNVKRSDGPFGAGPLRVLAKGDDTESATIVKNRSVIAAKDDIAIRKFRAAMDMPTDYGWRYDVLKDSVWRATVHPKALE